MTVYEIVAIAICVSLVAMIYFIIRTLKQMEKTLVQVEKTIEETRETTLKNIEHVTNDMKELTTDVKGKSKKLDPAFDAVEKIGQISTLAKVGYDLWKNKKKK